VTTSSGGTACVGISVDPAGKFAYVTNSGSNTVARFSIDPSTGQLTLQGTVATQSIPGYPAIAWKTH